MSKIDNMIAELCPNGVEYKRLGLFCTKASTVKWSLVKSNTLSYVDLSSVDIQTGRIGDLSEITRESAPSRAKQLIRENDVLFATTRPTQLRCCLVPPIAYCAR